MTNWHGYLLVTDFPNGWSNQELLDAKNALRGIGKQSDPQPAKINHTRERLDGLAIIIETEFDENEITRDAIIQLIADALNKPPGPIDGILHYEIFGEGLLWNESGNETRTYLKAHQNEWEPANP